MFSTEEFNHKLQAGQIDLALAQVLSEAHELDVTTQMTETIAASDPTVLSKRKSTTRQVPKCEYIRTKINLLTGEIHNEVGKDLIFHSSNYIKLQQLHIDQISASYQIVAGYLQEIQRMLTGIQSQQPGATISATVEVEESLNLSRIGAGLPSRLSAAFQAILRSKAEHLSENSGERDLQSSTLVDRPISAPSFDDGIDLSVDENTEVWEEWVEDEDFPVQPAVQYRPPTLSEVTIPDWGEDFDRPQLEPIPLKPSVSLPITSVEVDKKSDDFMPEYVGIYLDGKSPPQNINDPHQVDRLLADIDKIRKG